MNSSKDHIAREIFQERINKGLLGPGSDIFIKVSESKTEIISDFPLQRYYTGVLFPEQKIVKTHSENDENLVGKETETDEDETQIDNPIEYKDDKENTSYKKKKEGTEDDELKVSQNTFFPTNIGLTFCIDNSVKELKVNFNFGLYRQLDEKKAKDINDCKIQLEEHQYIDRILNNEELPQTLKQKIGYENGYIFFKEPITGFKGGKNTRSGDYVIFDEYKKKYRYNAETFLIEKLFGRKWKRKDISIDEIIKIEDTLTPKVIFEENLRIKTSNYLRAAYTVKTYKIHQNPNVTYVKIQLVNTSDEHPVNQFSNTKELLNQKCIFQAEINVTSPKLEPYKSYSELNPLDEEAEVLNYLYKEKYSYGIGHNCSVIWSDNKKEINTTFLPQYDIKDTKNNFSEDDFKENPKDFERLNESLDIYNLSHFSKFEKKKIIQRLKQFIDLYGKWIATQKQKAKQNSKVEKIIFDSLDYNLNRLLKNISLLENDTIFRAFQLANSAMLIQIIISNDSDFSGKEKEITDIDENIDYQNISFFESYDFGKLKFGRPRYRPFQLAFLLLNIDSITDVNSEARKSIVDLIWFPTGGGKTEAYLSVSAFTIIYRRLINDENYGGTSVIMRYTLRLLTAQQFERASRLIVALEFIRSHFEDELKQEPITIGMWVGMASTPNSLRETEDDIESLNRECNNPNGNPENKNVFQVSSCSWCGTKLISKNEHDNWVTGFKLTGKKKNRDFKIHCVNKHCHFHNKLPIQVVDEILYDNPPTLLFGTVDKFAMLAWKEKGNQFFNSLDPDKLPPDLIIQDELHLLTGPLGTITGIFESVIEILCTKNGIKPKIISSTATTRNTDEQIKALYGKDKKVNIFPPSGISADDSFFAKVSTTESKRRYIGFMPTGKSSIDTQLQLIANLFVARIEVYRKLVINGNKDFDTFDKYWTLVSYYNSLKDVGKIHNKVGDEISTFTQTLQTKLYGDVPNYRFNYAYLYNRDEELTSRIDSSKIKQTLKRLEEIEFNDETIIKSDNGNTYVKSGIIDLVLATNMISVGIDIERFNIMLINSQPKNVAEYIQASSRVGRKYKGLVVDLLDANRARDKSHFEHFIPFHQAFYKSVEPVSLTPFTENTIEKMLTSIVITYIRHKVPGMASNNSAQYFQREMLDDLKKDIKNRYYTDENSNVYKLFEKKLNLIIDDWLDKIEKNDLQNYEDKKGENGLLIKPSEKKFDPENLWSVMQSMREIDTNSYIRVHLPKRY